MNMDIMIIDPHHNIHPLPRLTLPHVLLKPQNYQQNLLSSCFAADTTLVDSTNLRHLFVRLRCWLVSNNLLRYPPQAHTAQRSQDPNCYPGKWRTWLFSEMSNELGY